MLCPQYYGLRTGYFTSYGLAWNTLDQHLYSEACRCFELGAHLHNENPPRPGFEPSFLRLRVQCSSTIYSPPIPVGHLSQVRQDVMRTAGMMQCSRNNIDSQAYLCWQH